MGAEALLYATKSAPLGIDLYTDSDLVGARESFGFEAPGAVDVVVTCPGGCDARGDARTDDGLRVVESQLRVTLLPSELDRV